MWPAGLLGPPQAQSTEATFFAASATAAAISVKPGVSERARSGASSSAPTMASCHGRDENGRRKDDEWPRLPLPNDSGETGPSPVMAPTRFHGLAAALTGKGAPAGSPQNGDPPRNRCLFWGAGARRRRRCGGGAKRENGEVLPRALLRTVRLTPSLLSLLPSPSPAAFLYNVPSFVPVRF